jgi:uncharacterized protein with HEPN domain
MVEGTAGDASLLLDMKLAAEDAREFPWGLDEAAFRASRLHQNAVIRSLEVIGEAAGKVSSVTQQQTNPAIPWREVTGMRHRLIHGYAEIRLELVWAVATERLPALIEALRQMFADESEQPALRRENHCG